MYRIEKRKCDHKVLNSSFKELLLTLGSIVNLSLQQQMELIKVFSSKKFYKGKCILTVGEIWDKLYFINQGIFRLYYLTEDGREFNKGFFYKNNFMYPIAPVAKKYPSRFSIEALSNVDSLVCNYGLFQQIMEGFGLWNNFAKFHAEWFAGQKVEREADFLLCSAKERYLKFVKENSDIANQIPDYHIASYLGITNVTLSRIKKTCCHFNIC